MHMTEESDRNANHSAKVGPGLRKRKGWIGFVHGYNDFLEKADWEAIDWGKDGDKSGAKSIERDGNKIVYRY